MQEICQSGSEGGAKRTFVPTPILCGVQASTDGEESSLRICSVTGRVLNDRADPLVTES